MCLGFALPQNFRFPYAAIGFTDFWRRWHITLSAWLRDYLYIPLGGNRKGNVRTYVNLMITMLFGGLWHGANWTFVVWGGLHGFYLWVEKFFRDMFSKKAGAPENLAEPKPVANTSMGFIYALLTFFLVNVTWVFFRAGTFNQAWTILGCMFGIITGDPMLTTMSIIKVWTVVTFMVVTHWWMRSTSLLQLAYKVPVWLCLIGWAIMLVALALSQESTSSFIYFQF